MEDSNSSGRLVLKAEFSKLIDALQDDQLLHFTHTLKHLASCYLSEDKHAALLLMDEADQSTSVMAINASRDEVTAMVQSVAEAMSPSMPVKTALN